MVVANTTKTTTTTDTNSHEKNTINNKNSNTTTGVASSSSSSVVQIEGPGPLDIICGMSRRGYQHAGNQKYQDLIEENSESYQMATNHDTRQILMQLVIQVVANYGGRFVQFDPDNGGWLELSREARRDKVVQDLRGGVRDTDAAATATGTSSSYPIPTGVAVIPDCALTSHDVLCYHPNRALEHVGNQWYNQLIFDHAEAYHATTANVQRDKDNKTALVKRIIEMVTDYGGRFFKPSCSNDNRKWVELTNDEKLQMVGTDLQAAKKTSTSTLDKDNNIVEGKEDEVMKEAPTTALPHEQEDNDATDGEQQQGEQEQA